MGLAPITKREIIMTKKTKYQQALEFAQQEARSAKTWVDLHNALFGIGGRCTEMFTTVKERTAFTKSKEHAQIMALMDKCREEKGEPSTKMVDLTENANGTILLRLPKSIHAALIAEAKLEGVSLNKLCLAKLATQLHAVG